MKSKEARIKELETQMESSDFWDNNTKAKSLIEESQNLKIWTIPYRDLESRFSNANDLIEEVFAINDQELIDTLTKELFAVDKGLKELEIRKMLGGELDNKNCYLSINSGAGGTESCDWALMLSRMYQRWAALRGWKCEVIDTVEGDVAGIKSLTMKLEGPFAYGYAKSEKGVHRLVRISPFDSNAKRHTSFASIDVTPEITDDIAIEIKPDDIRIDTYRSQGAGGQHVNKTDSAVRITHFPSGFVVSCQNERSQLQNKETCFKMLRSKLYEKAVSDREESLSLLGGEKKEIAWGSQIRNYVFHPYTLVKDTRTKEETSDVQKVMDGDIDPFVNRFLQEFG